MTDQAPATQFVTLDNETTQALFTNDGRVFYDLRSLIINYTAPVMERGILAAMDGDAKVVSEVAGARAVLQSIMKSADALLAEQGFETLTDEAVSGMAALMAEGFDPDNAPWQG